MDGQKNLAGQLTDWSIDDLLRIMEVTNKTGTLALTGDKAGRIHFRDGKVTGADLGDVRYKSEEPSKEVIADAIYVMSTSERGAFSLGEDKGPDTTGLAVEDVLAEVGELAGLESAVAASGMIEAPTIRLSEEIKKDLTLDPEQWKALVSLVQPFSFSNLEGRLGRGGAVRVLHALKALGVAEAVSVEDETEWLDRVADSVSAASSEPTWLETQAKAQEQVAESTSSTTESKAPSKAEPSEPAETTASADEAETSDEAPARKDPEVIKGVSAPASTTLTDGVYDEIRRLRSKAAEK